MFSRPPTRPLSGSDHEPTADHDDPDVHWELALEHRRRLRRRRRERFLERLGREPAEESDDREGAGV